MGGGGYGSEGPACVFKSMQFVLPPSASSLLRFTILMFMFNVLSTYFYSRVLQFYREGLGKKIHNSRPVSSIVRALDYRAV